MRRLKHEGGNSCKGETDREAEEEESADRERKGEGGAKR